MISLVHSAADFADTKLKLNMIECSYQGLEDVIAGCLGYEAIEECLNEEGEPLQALGGRLAGAEAIVFDSSQGLEQAIQLTANPEEVLAICLEALEREIRAAAPQNDMIIYHRMEDFYAGKVAQDMVKAVMEDQKIAATLGSGRADGNGLQMGQPICQGFWSDETCFFEAEGVWASMDGSGWLITCLLEYEKVGRVGFNFGKSVLGCSSLDELNVELGIMPLNTKVILPDGSRVRPSLALLVDPESRAVIGNALTVSDDMSQAIHDAVDNAFNGPNLLGTPLNALVNKPIVIDSDTGADVLIKNLLEKNICPEISYKPGSPKHRRLVDKVLERVSSRLAFGAQDSATIEHTSAVYTMADLTRLISQNIAMYHNQAQAQSMHTPGTRWAYIWEQVSARREAIGSDEAILPLTPPESSSLPNKVKVRNGGVMFRDQIYYSDDLKNLVGKIVDIRWEASMLDHIYLVRGDQLIKLKPAG